MDDRRTFLKKFAFYAGSGYLALQLPWIRSAFAGLQAGSAAGVKLGLIGVGSRGTYLLNFLQEIPGLEIIAFCDNYPPHFDRAQELIGPDAKGFVDYRKILELKELDAVLIATPLFEHARMTVDALEAGLHVFCEKAMAMTYEDCKRMVDARRRSGKILQIGYQRLFDVKYLNAIDMIRAGRLGKITQIRACWHRNNDWRRPVPSPELEKKINWRLYRKYSCGLMTELASHQIQVANWILKEHPEAVYGSGSINYWNDGREVFDNVNLVYRYPSGTHLVYDSMTSNAQYGFEEQIMGPKGTMELEAGKMWSENPPPAPGIVQLLNHIEQKLFDAIPVGGASWVPDDPNEDKGRYIVDEEPELDGSRTQLEAFVQSVRENQVTPGLLEEAYYASIAALMGYESMLNDEIVYFPEEIKMDQNAGYYHHG